MLNVMRGQGAMASQGGQFTRLGIVSAYNPRAHSIKVQFPPDGSETGWIPLGTLWSGNNWGLYAAPNINDQVEVTFQDGGQNAGLAGLRFYDAQNAPLSVPAGEFWVVHKSGQFFKLTNDGKASLSDAHGASITLNGDGTLTTTGTWTHNGNVALNGQVTANGHRIDDTHKHTGVATGGGVSGPPQ